MNLLCGSPEKAAGRGYWLAIAPYQAFGHNPREIAQALSLGDQSSPKKMSYLTKVASTIQSDYGVFSNEALMAETLTLKIPDAIYRRLLDTARATNRPLEDIVLRVFEVGSPPSWSDAPEPFQADLAALDRLDNESLWAIAYGQLSDHIPEQVETLVEPPTYSPNSENQEQLDALQMEGDRFMLRKAQAAAILRWRGCHVPLP